jgi:hypothetical protein
MGAGCRRTMFTKQVSRPVDGLDPPIEAAEAEQIERTRGKTCHGPDPSYVCPTRS